MQKKFTLNSNHQALKYLNNSSKSNRMHGHWIAYIQKFTFSLRHKSGQLNKVANALSRRVLLLTTIRSEIIGFDYLKDLYVDDEDFKDIWRSGTTKSSGNFQIHDGFLFFGDCLRIPRGSLWKHIIQELHAGGLGGHMG